MAATELNIAELEPWIYGLLERAAPSRRARVMRRIAIELRKRNMARIRAQQDPDGAPYEPRKRPRSRGGRAMFTKLRKRMLAVSEADHAGVGFNDGPARRARVHQLGLAVPVKPGGAVYAYPVRVLLGISAEDRAAIEGLVMEMLQ